MVKGFFIYFYTTKGSVLRTFEISLITDIPLPYDFPMGLIIQ